MSVIRILLSLLVLLPIPGHASTTYTFRFFEVCPACSTGTGGINNSGIAVLLTMPAGRGICTMARPPSVVTAVTVPHNNGRIPGAWLDSDGIFQPIVREPDGSFTTYPGYPLCARWSSQFRWVERVDAWDEHQDQVRRTAYRSRTREDLRAATAT